VGPGKAEPPTGRYAGLKVGQVVGSLARGLPQPLTSLVGRRAELEQLLARLETTRLLTLTGGGGVGKTRLALELARRAAPGFADGVAWVDLAPLADPRFLLPVVAAAVGLHGASDQPLADVLRLALRTRRSLVVVDNAEHLADAVAGLLEPLLRAARRPRWRCSRAPGSGRGRATGSLSARAVYCCPRGPTGLRAIRPRYGMTLRRPAGSGSTRRRRTVRASRR
jgi:hypothetical protein